MAKDMVDRTEIDVLNWKGVNKNDKKKIKLNNCSLGKEHNQKRITQFSQIWIVPSITSVVNVGR